MFYQKKQYNKNWKSNQNYSGAGARPITQFDAYRNLASAGVNNQNYDALTKGYEGNEKEHEEVQRNIFKFMENVTAQTLLPGASRDVELAAQSLLDQRRKKMYESIYRGVHKTYKEDYQRINSILNNDRRYLWCQEYGNKYKCRALLGIVDMALIEG